MRGTDDRLKQVLQTGEGKWRITIKTGQPDLHSESLILLRRLGSNWLLTEHFIPFLSFELTPPPPPTLQQPCWRH